MTLRRQLINFSHMSVDYRVGPHALDGLSPLFKGCVGKPVRALVVASDSDRSRYGEPVERALSDAGFSIAWCRLADDEDAATVACASRIFQALGGAGVTADDIVIALGGADVCGAVCWACRSWCGGTQAVLLPTTYDAMVTAACEMVALKTPEGSGSVSLRPEPSLVVCDLDILDSLSAEDKRLGNMLVLLSMFVDSRRKWDEFGEMIPDLVTGTESTVIQALCASQSARKDIVMAPHPAARAALSFGVTTASALRLCLGTDTPWYRLLAEGVRFESRLAVDVADFEVDDLFELDDRLEDLGIDELPFSLEANEFVDALRAVRRTRSNRFMLAVPACVGGVRLSSVDDEVLLRHAQAYLASRAGL